MGIFHSSLRLISLSVKCRLGYWVQKIHSWGHGYIPEQEEIWLFIMASPVLFCDRCWCDVWRMWTDSWFLLQNQIICSNKVKSPKRILCQMRCGRWGWTTFHMCLSTVADGWNRPLCRDAVMNDLCTLDLLKYPFCLMIALWRRWRILVSHKVVFVKETNCLPAINRTPSYSPSTDLVRWPIRDNKPYNIKFHF